MQTWLLNSKDFLFEMPNLHFKDPIFVGVAWIPVKLFTSLFTFILVRSITNTHHKTSTVAIFNWRILRISVPPNC